jgi:hypothetical protein
MRRDQQETPGIIETGGGFGSFCLLATFLHTEMHGGPGLGRGTVGCASFGARTAGYIPSMDGCVSWRNMWLGRVVLVAAVEP